MSRVFDAFALPRGVEPPVWRPGAGFHARERNTEGGASRGGRDGPPPSPSVPTTGGRMADDAAEAAVEVRHPDWDAEGLRRLAEILAARHADLARRSAAGILASLAEAGSRFLRPGDTYRRQALELLPATSGLSPAMAEAVLDGMAEGWRRQELEALVESELGCVERLDGPPDAPRWDGPGGAERTSAMPVGPRLCVQIVSGSVPGVGATALVRSLLVKGPTLLKAGRGDVVLPVLFARALAEVDAELADALAVLYWPGGSAGLEGAALARAEVVVAYGSDETVRRVRDLTPVTARFVAYRHRVSVGVVGREALDGLQGDRTPAEVARAVALFDQRGCVSPQVVYVEEDPSGGSARAGASDARTFADRLARALDELEERLPAGTLDIAEASAVQQVRGTAEMLAASGSEVEVMHGGDRSWTVVFEPEPAGLAGCVGRVVRVRPLASLEDLPRLLEPFADHLQTVGIAGLGERLEALAVELGRLGASRLAPFASVPFPPARWHHDGGRPLADLVRWVDVERG